MPLFPRRWAEYYQVVTGRPPRETLLMALDHFNSEALSCSRTTVGFAVDLGCGDGRDTAELLRCHWRVLAVDGEPDAIALLRNNQNIDRTYLETRVQRFEDLTLPPDVDLINASFCLPFCPPSHFSELWREIETALRPGGRFCGHLFGDRDSWAVFPDLTHHTRQQIDQLLTHFEVELLNEEEHLGKTALGEEKHWHLYHIIARKR
ncbi:class I SAM-dependent methyltransferase [Nodosilinea sp. LEGE 07088]|uniref:class I SAM-dependent methyltransferase n=1 Tax=Nodosilinea sp. LEGE 07088 TaxID=2777968 RepID=UPI001881F15B|nr:class I SAM-dependent methyltransferase [Nodosilinea sp. LEGE 07088]